MTHKSEHHHHKKRISKISLILVLACLGILLFLAYPLFVKEGSITGNTIKKGTDAIVIKRNPISASLTIPNISLKGTFEEIEIKLKENQESYLLVENQKIKLTNHNTNNIILKNFDGKIILNKEFVEYVEGYVSSILINDISFGPNSGRSKVSFSPDINYDFLDIKEEIYIEELDYKTTGQISLNNGKQEIKVENEQIKIQELLANIKINNNIFSLDGKFKNFYLKGEQNIAILTPDNNENLEDKENIEDKEAESAENSVQSKDNSNDNLMRG